MNHDEAIGAIKEFMAAIDPESPKTVPPLVLNRADEAIKLLSREPKITALWYRQEQQEVLLQKMAFELGQVEQHIATGRPGKDRFKDGRTHLSKFLQNHIDVMRDQKREGEGQ